MDTELSELATEAQKGNMEAFANLIMNLEQDFYRIASIRLKSADDIDDAIQMTIEDFENKRKFKNEYIENDRGEKFYPTISTSEDTGYSFIDMSYLLHWQTFNLNKYNATNTLKIYMNYNGEDIIIELERKSDE